MLSFWKRRKYKNDVLGSLYALLYLYPRGRDNLLKDYPGILDSIKTHFTEDTTPQRAALFIAGAIVANLIDGSLSDDQRTPISGQLNRLDVCQMQSLVGDVMAGRSPPAEITLGTLFFGNAILVSRSLMVNKDVEQGDFDMFTSELFGALSGKSAQERSAERVDAALDILSPLAILSEGDDEPLLPRSAGPGEFRTLSGTETKVHLVSTPTGIALIDAESGQQITQRRTMSQEDLRKTPQGLGVYRFVNLRTRSGEIYSCIIAGEDAEVFSSMRAFWWSLAKVQVKMVDVNARMTRMTASALARVHASARDMWDRAIREAHSIDDMRDLIMPLRNMHFEVIGKLREQTTSESKGLDLDIAGAMILATQSEAPKLEAYAYRCFKRFLWQPGEEPAEFQEYEAA